MDPTDDQPQARQRVLVTRQIFDEVLDDLRRGFIVDDNQVDTPLSQDQLTKRLAVADGVLCTAVDRIDGPLLDAAPRLRVVSNIAVGYNNIDVAACTRRGIVVTNTPGVLDDTTADLAFALMLAAARRVVAADRWTRAGHWDAWRMLGWLGSDVHHARLGIFGMGRIGQAVARRAAGFEMDVVYHNRHRLPEAIEQACQARWVSREALLAEADFIMLTLPYSAENHHYIGAAELAAMKPQAMLVNVGRGGLVDDAALAEALRAGRIAGAGLDVFEHEPALHPALRELDNVVLTPHIGSASGATRLRMCRTAADNLIAALGGRTPDHVVNAQPGGR